MQIKIPVFEIQRQNKQIGDDLRAAIEGVITSGVFILGNKVRAFETEFAAFCGVKYAVAVASGTDAITLGLRALNIEKGDEVIMPANSYPSVFGVAASGAKPVLVDINENNYTIDPEKIENAITKRTKAIMPVHMYGQSADMEKILAIGKRHKIAIVEDCAQAVGAECKIKDQRSKIKVKKVGSMGEIACFSFYPTKNLGAFGDGGMVVTSSEALYKKLKLLRMYGEESRYKSILVGANSRLDELQAAVLLVKLKHLEKWIEKRRGIATLYKSEIPASPAGRRNPKSEIILPYEESFSKHTYHLFVVRSNKRNELKAYLEAKGIGTGIHYPAPIHFQQSFEYLGYSKGDFPTAEKIANEVLSLPMFPELTKEEILFVAENLNLF
jgi:dTDP-4-amino-4,6-dideoxygalactose transaminase